MKTLLIILAIYVALDIISGVAIYIILRLNGWTGFEMAREFRNLIKFHQEDYVDAFAYRYGLTDNEDYGDEDWEE